MSVKETVSNLRGSADGGQLAAQREGGNERPSLQVPSLQMVACGTRDPEGLARICALLEREEARAREELEASLCADVYGLQEEELQVPGPGAVWRGSLAAAMCIVMTMAMFSELFWGVVIVAVVLGMVACWDERNE